MNTAASNIQNTEVYHQSIPIVVLIVIISAMVATYVFYSSYSKTESLAQLIFANMFLFIAIMFAKPIVEWRKIEIDDKYITIHKRFFKPIVIHISQSLYQVVMHNNDIQSYRFRVGDNYTQISPQIYKNGHKLSKRLKDHIARNKLLIDAVN